MAAEDLGVLVRQLQAQIGSSSGSGLSAAYAKGAYISATNQGPVAGSGGQLWLALNTVVLDNKGALDLVSQPTRLTAKDAGVYIFIADISLDSQASTSGGPSWHIYKNGRVDANIISGSRSVTQLAKIVSPPTPMVVGDYVELRLFNGTGANVSILGNAYGTDPNSALTSFSMFKVG